MEELNEKKEIGTAAILEALLFAYGAPISVSRLGNIIGLGEDEVRAALEELRQSYDGGTRGLGLLQNGGEVQLSTAPEVAPYVEKLMKEEFREDLTPAALETLAIVTYRGPIFRAEVDAIRGVNSSFMLRHLLIRGLVSREVDPKRSNVYLYRPSFDFLRLLGITRPEELPDFEELSKRISQIELAESGPPDTASLVGGEESSLELGSSSEQKLDER